jgi:hypothetical protein
MGRVEWDERFWARVDRSAGPSSCWPWTGHRLPCRYAAGYGRLGIGDMSKDGRMVLAHRVAWELTRGAIPFGLYVCHRCDNRPCCNPDHLFLGTARDNAMDASIKGRIARITGARHGSKTHPERIARGERHGISKLTEADVRDVRSAIARGAPTRRIAASYSVCKNTVCNIASGRTWAHVL